MVKDLNIEFTLQQGESDCGVACLLSIIKYYGGYDTLENLRLLSGTNITGTTLLGLYQAANQVGFKAEGCESNIAVLIKHSSPIILHVAIENQLQHYMFALEQSKKLKKSFLLLAIPHKESFIYRQRN